MYRRLGLFVAIGIALGGCATASTRAAPEWVPTCCRPDPEPRTVDYYIDPIGLRSSGDDDVPRGMNVRVVLVNANPLVYEYSLAVDTATRQDVEAHHVLSFLFPSKITDGLPFKLMTAQIDTAGLAPCQLAEDASTTVSRANRVVESVEHQTEILRTFALHVAVINSPDAVADTVWQAITQGAEEAEMALAARDSLARLGAHAEETRHALSALGPFNEACEQEQVHQALGNLNAATARIEALTDAVSTENLRVSAQILQRRALDPSTLYRTKFAPPHRGRHNVTVVVARTLRVEEGEKQEILQRQIAVDRSPHSIGMGFTVGIQPRHTYRAAKRSVFDPGSGAVVDQTIVVREAADDFRVVPTVNLLYALRQLPSRPNLNLGIGVDPADGKPTLEFALGFAMEPVRDLNLGVGVLTGKEERLADGFFVGDRVAEGASVSRNVNTFGFAVSLIYRVR